jgi:hypothetical protein
MDVNTILERSCPVLKNRSIARAAFVLGGVFLASLISSAPLAAQELSEQATRQIQAILADKATWTPTERKLATSVLMAHRQSRGQAMVQGLGAFPEVAARAGVDGNGMAVVDIKARVTDELLRVIGDVGGELISSHPSYGTVRARLPIGRVDAIAALPEVRFVGPKELFVLNTGSVTSQGDVAHAAAAARTTFGINGSGVRVGVLSDGVDSLAARQLSGDLPVTCATPPAPGACVGVVPGQGGAAGADEGTAMLEIVHDLAPGAQLFFATADGGQDVFASNIQTLRNTYGCDIIVDDVTYFLEGPFQDGPIAQAVNAVKASGALYFSSAGNSGRLSAGTSGTWEGDFVNSGITLAVTGLTPARPMHSFNGLTGASAATSDQLTATNSFIILGWSDPLGGSANDYDLFRLDSGFTTVLDYGIDSQTGTQDPVEFVTPGSAGDRIVVTQYAGAGRALRIDTNRGRLSIATKGAVFGHNGGDSTISVAATDGRTPGPGNPFTGGSANPAETYSSDGPRRIFYNPDGSAITPGNVLFGSNGGRLLRKPDITAADCVAVTTPGFSPFCGTSAAAPHAAAIAALLKSAPNSPSGGQALAAMFTTALDVSPGGLEPGWDRNSGVGIVMANSAANVLINIPTTSFFTVSPCRVFDTRVVTGPTAGAPLTCGTDLNFAVGGTCGVPASVKSVSLNVTATEPTAKGNLSVFAAGAPAPLVSSLNYAAGLTRANNAVTPLSASGQIAVHCAPSGTTHVIVDVNGYFQ